MAIIPAAINCPFMSRPFCQRVHGVVDRRQRVVSSGGAGGAKRRSPTGGAAKGMPLNMRTPLGATTPSSTPVAIRTRGPAGAEVGETAERAGELSRV